MDEGSTGTIMISSPFDLFRKVLALEARRGINNDALDRWWHSQLPTARDVVPGGLIGGYAIDTCLIVRALV